MQIAPCTCQDVDMSPGEYIYKLRDISALSGLMAGIRVAQVMNLQSIGKVAWILLQL